MLRSVLLGTILLLALVPAMPGAAAIDPCDRGAKVCPLVYRGDDWACVGARIDYESGGVCAEASPACVTSGWGRAQERTCLTEPASAVDPCKKYGVCVYRAVGDDWACAGAGLGYQGVVACAEASPACVRVSYGLERDTVCLDQSFGAESGCEVACDIVRIENGSVCVAVAPEVNGPIACAAPKAGCASVGFGIVRENACARDLAEVLP